ncbi:hypothetical protein [Paenibacillus contaminans]|uniref:DUF1146 domain-containing protein n=1 Tax=Paenibacillus contaminans TaxID=450362 RepID=A0A329MM25_9BACL|nr:hypothetical protein [Paenibacillus contaminans]RAV20578.1 hypothetical protein DQG23_13765 [Paenibacillus contaminans]
MSFLLLAAMLLFGGSLLLTALSQTAWGQARLRWPAASSSHLLIGLLLGGSLVYLCLELGMLLQKYLL